MCHSYRSRNHFDFENALFETSSSLRALQIKRFFFHLASIQPRTYNAVSPLSLRYHSGSRALNPGSFSSLLCGQLRIGHSLRLCASSFESILHVVQFNKQLLDFTPGSFPMTHGCQQPATPLHPGLQTAILPRDMLLFRDRAVQAKFDRVKWTLLSVFQRCDQRMNEGNKS